MASLLLARRLFPLIRPGGASFLAPQALLKPRLFTTVCAASSYSLLTSSYSSPTPSTLVTVQSSRAAVHVLQIQQRNAHTYIWKKIKNKVASKRKDKHYKLKNHSGAVARWLVVGGGMFKRAKAGHTRINSCRRQWKRITRRKRVLATSTQRNLLKKLIPYHRKKYMK
ncbi:hypothetical protein BSLG_006187 [Batrachochytrium salamandrivorans]|nr:hypothetical protein BASA60_009777 [Batrachochytrium salamandrivorans]KAH6572312.1 hypothetical protein BASA62_003461 [Batrachochytrium salamandrivorans]KAH9250204.1 hypothetical protein BASA81_012012 [Batrachochytrium salamandrivorans]KAH9273701.1 hypothetical protein BASA83_004034 [Batrachochytrium salamandrivorans]KAJ1339048.1 hypothetical protein BSLG_006187 [Batrachochytrium salamandrivorans]